MMIFDHPTPTRYINAVAAFLSTATGFIVTFLSLVVGVAIGAVLHFDQTFMFAFNIFLSVAAIVISGIILVSAARSEAAVQVKLDYLIEYSRASNRAVGIEHKDFHEIEAERQKVEAEVAGDLEDAIEQEVTEQLDQRAALGTPRAEEN